mmetsp:Transcript_22936/g.54258  ORF Transcript_22936/g.54258 Transcript_22936/m.54258 type:complete len:231 (+) Transcript_22936:389-1081(+)
MIQMIGRQVHAGFPIPAQRLRVPVVQSAQMMHRNDPRVRAVHPPRGGNNHGILLVVVGMEFELLSIRRCHVAAPEKQGATVTGFQFVQSSVQVVVELPRRRWCFFWRFLGGPSGVGKGQGIVFQKEEVVGPNFFFGRRRRRSSIVMIEKFQRLRHGQHVTGQASVARQRVAPKRRLSSNVEFRPRLVPGSHESIATRLVIWQRQRRRQESTPRSGTDRDAVVQASGRRRG